jgi:dUTP pyrophosphatase
MRNKMRLNYYLTPRAKAAGCKFRRPRLGDAGYDICSEMTLTLPAGVAMKIPTGLHVEVPLGWVGLIKDRSGFASNSRAYKHAGVIDSIYRGHVQVLLHNTSERDVRIYAGTRIAQMIVVPCLIAETREVSLNELTPTDRGDGGFGSTGE